jgi:hypothetical protein
MADASYIKSLFGGVSDDVKKAADQAFTYLLGNLRLGPFTQGKRATNFQWYWLSGTTHADANTEFSVAHGLGRTPYVVLPVLPLDQVNARIVTLQVTRAADASRIYLSSASTSAVIALLVE